MISGNAADAALYPHLDFNFVRDIEAVAFLGYTPFVVVVNPSVPFKTFPEFLAYAKANPGKLNWATPGAGTAPHLAGELLMMMTGVKLVQVPYRTSYMPDLLNGRIQLAFIAAPPALGYIRSGKLRALAVTSTKRLNVLPNVPTIAETVPGYEGSGWAGVGAPKNTPVTIVEKLSKEINAVLIEPKINKRLVSLGVVPDPMTPPKFGKLIADAAEKWAKVIKFANLKARN
jgi:tripartite-type tricarboxylate transporter receptor subunit TctC